MLCQCPSDDELTVSAMVRPGSVEVVHAVFDRVVNHLLNFFFIDGSILMQRQAHAPESQSGQSLRAGFIVLHSLSPFFTHPAGTGCFLHNPYPDFAVSVCIRIFFIIRLLRQKSHK